MNTKNLLIISAVTLTIIYFALFSFARNGYGYVGHGGYHRGPSFWYFGGPRIYTNRSGRSGSIGGASTRGGGPGSGK